MHFELREEQQQFQDTVLRFARDELASGALERAHDPNYPWDVSRKMADMGLGPMFARIGRWPRR